MADPLVVRSFKRFSDLFRDRQRLVQRNRSPHDLIRERWSFNEFHHKRAHAVGVCKTMDVRDVRMVERRKQLCFATKAREAIGIVGEGRKQTLIATSRCSVVSRARYTSPIPPAPMRDSTS